MTTREVSLEECGLGSRCPHHYSNVCDPVSSPPRRPIIGSAHAGILPRGSPSHDLKVDRTITPKKIDQAKIKNPLRHEGEVCFGFILVAAISIIAYFCQSFPSFNWMQEVGGTGADFMGLATRSARKYLRYWRPLRLRTFPCDRRLKAGLQAGLTISNHRRPSTRLWVRNTRHYFNRR